MLSLLINGDIENALIFLFSAMVVVFLASPFHEFAHAITAHWLGDDTAKYQGRLTLNPFAHIDWFGATMILLVGYGYAKPVPVNANNFRYSKVGIKGGMALSALAGPVSNLLMATVFAFIMNLSGEFITFSNFKYMQYFTFFFYYIVIINISLAVFNLLPIPPLDGSKILFSFLPSRYYFSLLQYERYVTGLLFVLIISGALDGPLNYLVSNVFDFVMYIAGLPFGI